MDDATKNNLMLSYGCGYNSTIHPAVYVDPGKYGIINPHSSPEFRLRGGGLVKIMDITKSVYNHDNNNATFKNQHNLMAKTPYGNIIDVEKCICPGTQHVKSWRAGSDNSGRPVASCA